MNDLNFLEGWACPKCGHTGGFRIVGTLWLDVTEDGTVPSEAPGRGDHEWDGDSLTECPACGYMGKQSEFDGTAAEDALSLAEEAVGRKAKAEALRDVAVLAEARLRELERKVAYLDLLDDNLRWNTSTMPAASPENVRDMVYDAIEDARRGRESETGRRRDR